MYVSYISLASLYNNFDRIKHKTPVNILHFLQVRYWGQTILHKNMFMLIHFANIIIFLSISDF